MFIELWPSKFIEVAMIFMNILHRFFHEHFAFVYFGGSYLMLTLNSARQPALNVLNVKMCLCAQPGKKQMGDYYQKFKYKKI